MKKIFSLMLFMASLVSVTSCDYIDDLFTETVNIKVGESKTIESPNSSQWYGEWVSDNPFVAYAVGQKVYGNKVGKARFRAVRSSNPIYTTKSTEYVVNVFPSFTLFEDPIIQWGMSQEKLISKRGTPDSSNDNYIFTDVNQVEGVETTYFDITDLDAVEKMVTENDVKVIVNCAAWTNVDGAEDPEKYELVEKIGIVSEGNNGWNKELNLISWNEREPVYDIRTWSPDHEKMGKGVTISVEEAKVLRDMLNKLNLD